MAASRLSGGSNKRALEEEEEANANDVNQPAKKRRTEILAMDMAAVKDCVLLTKTNIEWRAALKHLFKCVLDGGVAVKLGQVQLYPGFDDDSEKQLMETLENAILWRMTLGFVLVLVKRKPKFVWQGDSADDSEDGSATLIKEGYKDSIDTYDKSQLRHVNDTNAMDIDPDPRNNSNRDDDGLEAMMLGQESERATLEKEDLEFIVPSLGYGSFRSFLDMEEYKYKVDYIRTREEKANEDLAFFVYTQEEPVLRAVGSGEKAMVAVWPSSPASRLTKHARMLDNFLMSDEQATQLATFPIPVAQERPPTKDSTALARGSDYGFAGAVGADGRVMVAQAANGQQQFGKPHITPRPETKMSAEDMALLNNKTVQEMREHTYFIKPGYVYSGLLTPHAYPRISDRRTDYTMLVSTETSVPAHVIVPGKPAGASSGSSGMTGSTAGGKQQASGTKHASSGEKKQQSGGFTSDPSFNTALDLRDFLQNFFQAIMRVKNGEKLARYMTQTAAKNDREMQIKQRLVEEFDQLIKTAQDAVVGFGEEISGTIGLRQETSHLEAAAHRDSFKPEAIAASNKAGDGTTKGPTTIPEAPAEPGSNIPTAPDVEVLTQRRLQVVNDMRSISEAIELQRKMMSTERPIALMWRQPFVNDTSNIAGVMELLGLPEEQSHDVAMRRFGLKS